VCSLAYFVEGPRSRGWALAPLSGPAWKKAPVRSWTGWLAPEGFVPSGSAVSVRLLGAGTMGGSSLIVEPARVWHRHPRTTGSAWPPRVAGRRGPRRVLDLGPAPSWGGASSWGRAVTPRPDPGLDPRVSRAVDQVACALRATGVPSPGRSTPFSPTHGRPPTRGRTDHLLRAKAASSSLRDAGDGAAALPGLRRPGTVGRARGEWGPRLRVSGEIPVFSCPERRRARVFLPEHAAHHRASPPSAPRGPRACLRSAAPGFEPPTSRPGCAARWPVAPCPDLLVVVGSRLPGERMELVIQKATELGAGGLAGHHRRTEGGGPAALALARRALE